MPYIKDENNRRGQLDSIVRLMQTLRVSPKGDLNYILFKFAKTIVPSYNNYKELIGELDCCAKEIYRRLVAPYENKKIIENGDVD